MSFHRALFSCRCSVLAGMLPLLVAADGAEFVVSPSGNDAADGSLATPFRTIGKAMSVAMPGDSVKLRAGTYRETILPVRSGTAGSPITIENYNGEQAVVSALDAAPGPWTAQGNGVFATTVTGARPVSFWNAPGTSANGSGMTDAAGNLLITVANESAFQTTSLRSSAASASWDFFSNAVTWQVRGLSASSVGATAMPLSSANLYFSIMNAASSGYVSEDAVNVAYRGDGRLALNLKKNTANSFGAAAQTVVDAAVNGFDLTLGPASGGSVPYTFTVKKSSGADVVLTGSWTIEQSEWSDGGTGTTSYLGMVAQESVTATTDVTQKFAMTVGSYTVAKGATTVLRDEFDDGDVASVEEFPGAVSAALSSGYDQVFVDGAMQHEARTPNHGAGTLLQPATASVTVTNASAGTNPNTISSATFGGQVADFYAGARFVGGVGQGWSQQAAVVTASAGNLLTVNPATKSTWWWPDQEGAGNTSDTGKGFVFGLLNLLDADGEWFLDQPASTLSLRIAGGADPAGHLVEIKRRNWCVLSNFSHITVRGLKTIGGATRLNGAGLVLENCEASHLSHFLTWTTGSAANGGRSEGGGVAVSGTGNTVRGCIIHDTAGSGITTTGSGHLVTRNLLHHIDYSGTYAAPLALLSGDTVATFNTIHDTGRDGIRPLAAGLTIMFNDVSLVGRLAHDLACVYTFGLDAIAGSGTRTRIAYNWVHDRGDTSDGLSVGLYLDNGCRNFLVDHNVVWNVASGASNGAIRLNSPAFGHELYHNTVIGAGTYNETTYTNYPDNTVFGGYTFTDATHGLDFLGQNNIEVPGASTSAAFENFAVQDFTPKTAYTFTDERYVSPVAAVNPPATNGNVEWIKAAGNTNLANSYLVVAMTNPTAPFFYREAYGHGQTIAGIDAWAPDGQPDSGAYERGVARWVPGVNGWEGLKCDPPVGVGARTAILQGVRLAVDAAATNVRLYYGSTDGGTSAGTWENSIDLGTAAPGDVLSVFRPARAGLTPGASYHARFFASNANGAMWSDAQSFTTAASLTWDAGGGASTGLGTNTNWLADATPDLAGGGEIATFGSAGSTAMIDGAVSLLGLVIDRDANFTIADGAGSLTLGAAGLTVTLPGTTARTHAITESSLVLAADQTWSVTNNTGAATLNISSSIGDGAGAFGFTKTGSGTVALSGGSDFDGAVNVNAGILAIAHANALGSAAGATTIAATGSTATGGQLRLSGGIACAENFVITGTTEAGNFARAIESTSGTNILSGSITLVGNSQIRLGPVAGTLHLDGPIARSGTDLGALMLAPNTGATVSIAQPIDTNGGQLNITGGGTVVLNASSPDLGATVIFFGSSSPNGPVLRLGAHNALPVNRPITIGTTSTSNGADKGTLDLAGFDQTITALTGQRGTGATPSPASTRRVTNSVAATTSTITFANGAGAFDGTIEDGAGIVAVTKSGTGTQTLSQPCTYTGPTTVTGGTLSLATASLGDTSEVILAGGGTLDLNFSGADAVGVLRIGGVAQSAGTWGGVNSSATFKTARITGPGVLSVVSGPAQPPYASWAAARNLASLAGFTDDPEGDGLANGLEYVLDADPLAPSAGALPTLGSDTANYGFSFSRSDASEGSVTLALEWSIDLLTWHDVAIGVASTGPDANGIAVSVTENSAAPDSIEVAIPKTLATQGELFVRLKATMP